MHVLNAYYSYSAVATLKLQTFFQITVRFLEARLNFLNKRLQLGLGNAGPKLYYAARVSTWNNDCMTVERKTHLAKEECNASPTDFPESLPLSKLFGGNPQRVLPPKSLWWGNTPKSNKSKHPQTSIEQQSQNSREVPGKSLWSSFFYYVVLLIWLPWPSFRLPPWWLY